MSEALRKAAEQALSALEAHGQMYPHMVKGYCVDAICELRAALAEPEQSEPVGYLNKHTGQFFSDVEGYKGSLLQPLFAHPPRREPLSDEQIDEIFCKVSEAFDAGLIEHESIGFARAIEQAHGITGEKT